MNETSVEKSIEKPASTGVDAAASGSVIERVRVAVGIKCACCVTCVHMTSDTCGGEPESSVSWSICEKFDRYQYLKSFPFKKTMPCWEPDFWSSKFAGEIRRGTNRELDRCVKRFREAIDAASQNNEVSQRLPAEESK